jgi:hypothetical protein
MTLHMENIFLKLLAVFMTRKGTLAKRSCACCEGHARECWCSGRVSHGVSVQTAYAVLAIVCDGGGGEVVLSA